LKIESNRRSAVEQSSDKEIDPMILNLLGQLENMGAAIPPSRPSFEVAGNFTKSILSYNSLKVQI
jgi:hypothetical protein